MPVTIRTAARILVVSALWPEAGVRWGEDRQTRLEVEQGRVARFTGLESVRFEDGWLRPD